MASSSSSSSSHQSFVHNLIKTRTPIILSLILFLVTTLNLNFVNSVDVVPSHILSLTNACRDARDVESCSLAIISNLGSPRNTQAFDLDQLLYFFQHSKYHINKTMTFARNLKNHQILINSEHGAIEICIHLLDMSIDRLVASIAVLSDGNDDYLDSATYSDLLTWLSGILTNHDTCLDVLQGSEAQLELESRIHDLMTQARVSLALLRSLSFNSTDTNTNTNTTPEHEHYYQPSWVTKMDVNDEIVIPDVVVSQDGSGDYMTVGDALESAPNKSDHRYVIYIKQGTYEENVRVPKKKTNITLIGEGMHSTIITGSLNNMDGVPTFHTATLIVEGDGFIGQELWIMNTAGPEKRQAVALRVSSDKTVITRCKMDAFQDTLYAHKDRQFYKDCIIKGTIDFIFGNAAAVLQNCTIVARLPMDGQSNMITAQSKSSPLQNTGFSIQMSRIRPSEYLRPVQDLVQTYLGRPWKNYSTTVIMQSSIEVHIDPSGWTKWNDYTDTTSLYYGEYNNTGPGSNTTGRVDWDGFHVINDSNVAMSFTVSELINGASWLNSTGVEYINGLEIFSDLKQDP